MIFFSLLLWNCNAPNKKTAVVSTDSIIKPTDTSHATPNDDSDDQELTAIVNDFKSQYNKNYNVDTTFTREADSFKLVFNYKCLFDNGLSIPEKYVGIYGFKTFKAHNFVANLLLYKNNNKILDDKIIKSTFANQTDESLKQYGDLLYPSLKIEDSLVKVHFSISIPLTDVGVGTNYIATLNGRTYVQTD